jgi:integrase
MPIKPTPGGGFEVSVCVQYRRLHRRLPPGSSAGDAKRVEAELRLALERARTAPTTDGAHAGVPVPGDPRLTAVMALYAAAAQHLRSPDTALHHAARIGRWVDLYTASQARQCAAHIVRDMRGHYAPATINRSLGALKRALTLAWEAGHTATDHSPAVRRLPEHNARSVYLSIEQVKALADHASPNVRAAIWLALLTGCRRGEILQIQPAHIGPDTITLPAGNTKTLRTRTVPIVPALRPWLAWLPLQINAEGLKTGFRRAREAAGMPHVHFHDLRHSCATILLSLGAPLHVVRDVLGHTSIKTTERYAHAMVEPQRAALAQLGQLQMDLHQDVTPDAATAPKGRASR